MSKKARVKEQNNTLHSEKASFILGSVKRMKESTGTGACGL